MPEPICGACHTRPRKLKSLADGLPVYYDWCVVCRKMAGLDRIAADVHHFRRVMGDQVDDEPAGREPGPSDADLEPFARYLNAAWLAWRGRIGLAYAYKQYVAGQPAPPWAVELARGLEEAARRNLNAALCPPVGDPAKE